MIGMGSMEEEGEDEDAVNQGGAAGTAEGGVEVTEAKEQGVDKVGGEEWEVEAGVQQG